MKLLDNLNYGWAFPAKAKKAHLFNTTIDNRDISACGKYSIGWINGKAYLPISAFMFKSDMCQKCLQSIKGKN